jgi:hypothetical protein
VFVRTIALRIVNSFRMHAVRATFFGFPARGKVIIDAPRPSRGQRRVVSQGIRPEGLP